MACRIEQALTRLRSRINSVSDMAQKEIAAIKKCVEAMHKLQKPTIGEPTKLQEMKPKPKEAK